MKTLKVSNKINLLATNNSNFDVILITIKKLCEEQVLM